MFQWMENQDQQIERSKIIDYISILMVGLRICSLYQLQKKATPPSKKGVSWV